MGGAATELPGRPPRCCWRPRTSTPPRSAGRSPAQAAVRGGQAVRARRRPGDGAGGAAALRQTVGRPRRGQPGGRRHGGGRRPGAGRHRAAGGAAGTSWPAPRSPPRRSGAGWSRSAAGRRAGWPNLPAAGTPSRRRGAVGGPAVLASGPDRPGRPDRGGGAAGGLRQGALGAAALAARPGLDRRAAAAPVGVAGAGRGRLHRGDQLPVRLAGRARRLRPGARRSPAAGAAAGQPDLRRRAGAAHLAAAGPAGQPQPQPRPGQPGSRDLRDGPGVPAGREDRAGAAAGRRAPAERRRARRHRPHRAGPAAPPGRRAGRRPGAAGLVGTGPAGRLGRRRRGRPGGRPGGPGRAGDPPGRRRPVAPGPVRASCCWTAW